MAASSETMPSAETGPSDVTSGGLDTSWTAAVAVVLPTLEAIWSATTQLNFPQLTNEITGALTGSDPFVSSTVAMLLFALLCWVLSLPTGNYSHVDRLWSISPFIFCWIHAIASGPISEFNRVHLITVLVTAWGLRLTYNFARKGGYRLSTEDYRWMYVRHNFPFMNAVTFQIFNFVFISFYQNFLLLLISAPVYVVFLHQKSTNVPLTPFDYALAALFSLTLFCEWLADQQQWNYQTAKHELSPKQRKGDFADGFLQRGLWRYSRHPNFFCEISIWWEVYGFSLLAQNLSSAEPVFANWTLIGPVLLTMLFHGSTMLTEHISSEKYPKYRAYQQATNRLIPWAHTDVGSKKKKSS